MSNYYYLGRSAFPDILIWVSLSLMIAGSGMLVMMAGLSASSAAEAQKELIVDDIQRLDHDFNGGNLDSAMVAFARYRQDKGKLGAEENFIKDMLNNARLERRHARKMMAMLLEGMSDAEVTSWLGLQVKEGLNPRMVKESTLIGLYEGLINGTDRPDELRELLTNDPRIPIEVVDMTRAEGFEFADGARARLNFFKGHNSNTRVQLDDLLRQQDEAHLKTNAEYEKRITLLPDLKKQYFEKSRKLDEEREKNRESQGQAWNQFLEETKEIIGQRRKTEILIYEKEQELKQKQGLLGGKVQGQDWIPPLDLIDGKILVTEDNTKMVTIDIGRTDALRVGQGFDVFRVKGDVIQKKKGRVEVVELLPKIAVCKILDSLPLDPIVAGDVVANGENDHPFDRKHSPTYILSGQFLKSYSKDLVSYLIDASGGVVQSTLHKNIDFMILGDVPDEEDIKTCRQLGVRTVRVRDIPMHLGYTLNQVESIQKNNWN